MQKQQTRIYLSCLGIQQAVGNLWSVRCSANALHIAGLVRRSLFSNQSHCEARQAQPAFREAV
ncbi:MAG: hypothetical protein LBH75_09390 [Treponema sp.]|nr:hypothetical protein [Treponema sp.]